jgi:putative endonuclease
MTRKELGRKGEDFVCRILVQKGFEFICKNWCCVGGEIDLILKYKEMYIFVEVKTVTGVSFGFPEERLTSTKIRSLSRAIKQFVLRNNISLEKCRMDLACCYFAPKRSIVYYSNVLQIC